MSLWRKNARLPCTALVSEPDPRKIFRGSGSETSNAPGTSVRVPVRTELEQTEESGEDVSAHADLQNADICPTCTQAIVEAAVDTEGQEAILCEGSCNCWYHRWCAGVSTLRYKALSMSEEPFLCPSCTADRHRQCIHEQQQAIRELQGCVRSLSDEVRELKGIVASMHEPSKGKNPNAKVPAAAPESHTATGIWSVVAGKNGTKSKGKGKSLVNRDSGMTGGKPNKPKDSNKQRTQSSGSPGGEPTRSGEPRSTQYYKRIQINGARRIWCTVKTSCSKGHPPAAPALQLGMVYMLVKRKNKTAGDTSKRVIRWWFVVRDEEANLQRLQEEWPQISAQTAWKLEPLYSYDTSTAVTCQQPPSRIPHSSAQSHRQVEPPVTSPAQQSPTPTQPIPSPEQSTIVRQQEPDGITHSSSDVHPTTSPF